MGAERSSTARKSGSLTGFGKSLSNEARGGWLGLVS